MIQLVVVPLHREEIMRLGVLSYINVCVLTPQQGYSGTNDRQSRSRGCGRGGVKRTGSVSFIYNLVYCIYFADQRYSCS